MQQLSRPAPGHPIALRDLCLVTVQWEWSVDVVADVEQEQHLVLPRAGFAFGPCREHLIRLLDRQFQSQFLAQLSGCRLGGVLAGWTSTGRPAGATNDHPGLG